MKSFFDCLLSFCALVLSAGVLLTVSCSHNPRKVSQPPASAQATEAVSDYVKSLIDSPEMFPRERLRAERTLELRLSWAMRKATDEGKIRVRAIAPPLQLTGDPSIDLSLTHNVLLVADDLRTNETFLDVYEVRVGPSPQLAVIRPAAASDSLAEADKVLAEERLTRLRLDQQTLKADVKYAATLGPRLTNHVAEATNAAASLRDKLDLLVQELQTTFTNATKAFSLATNAAADALAGFNNATNALAQPGAGDDEKQAAAAAQDKLRAAEASVVEAWSKRLTIEQQIAKLNVRKNDLYQDEEMLRRSLAAFARRADASLASEEAIGGLVAFWTDMLNKGELLSGHTNFTAFATPYLMPSAVVVSFRAQALRGLSQITLDVVRRVADTKSTAKSSSQMQADERVVGLLGALQDVGRPLPQLNGLLLAEDAAIEPKSRAVNLKIQGDRLNEAVGNLVAQMIIFNNGVSAIQTTELSSDLTAATRDEKSTNSLQALQRALLASTLKFQQTATQALAGATSGTNSYELEVGHVVTHVSALAANTWPELGNLNKLGTALPAEREALMARLNQISESLSRAIPQLTGLDLRLERVESALTNLQAWANSLADGGVVLGALTNTTAALIPLANRADEIHRELILTRDKLQQAGVALKAEAAVETKFKAALEQVDTNLSGLAVQLTRGQMMSAADRNAVALKVTNLRQSLTQATALAQGTSKARQRVMSVLSGNPVMQDGSTRLTAAAPGDDVVARILQGNQAVFRLNVLRGVVSTTAFLLPDDGAAQMFGQAFADSFYAAQVTFRNPNDKPILIYGNTMRLVVRMNAAEPTGIDEAGEPARKIWWATWEPLDYDALRRMLEGMQEHSWQRYLSKGIDLASLGLGFYGVAARPSEESLRFIAAFGGAAPQLKSLLEADLKRHASNFREKGLNNIEEIPENGTLTRYVFLPKGPIYGTFAFGLAEANEIPLSAEEGRNNPFKSSSRDFAKKALQPAYIHDLRREEVYVEGKRILASDPLTPASR